MVRFRHKNAVISEIRDGSENIVGNSTNFRRVVKFPHHPRGNYQDALCE